MVVISDLGQFPNQVRPSVLLLLFNLVLEVVPFLELNLVRCNLQVLASLFESGTVNVELGATYFTR